MPADFDACVKGGGRVKTINPTKGKYIHICYPKDGGPPVAGEVKDKKED